jgi:hypothetical protein
MSASISDAMFFQIESDSRDNNQIDLIERQPGANILVRLEHTVTMAHKLCSEVSNSPGDKTLHFY